MLQCNSYIKITPKFGQSIEFSFVNSIEIESSYEDLTDTCKITIPRKLQFEGKNLFVGDNPIFKRGDKIEVKIGYVPNLTTVFNGYIKNISGNIPTYMECEDEMYLLKQYTINYPSKVGLIERTKKGKLLKHPKVIPFNIMLDELLDYALPYTKFKTIDNIPLGSFRATNATPAMILDKLKTEYGLFSYFIEDTLMVGFANDASRTKEAEFKMEEVVINSADLEWQNESDIKIKVKVVSMMPDNSKIEVESGDPDGDQKTIHKYNLSESAAKEVADNYVKDFKYTGFRGNLETFGEPVLYHGDRCKITSTKLPERNGTYLIKKVTRKYSVDGGNRQIFNLGIKVA